MDGFRRNLMENDLTKIIKASVNSPSGSNSQPWKFIVHENVVDVIAEPEKDHPILNFRNRGTFVAHGALIENIVISASAFGYKPAVVLFPDESNKNITARISFTKIEKFEDSLFSSIPCRVTNRKPYSKMVLAADQKEELKHSEKEVDGGEIFFIEGEKNLIELGMAVSVNEIVMLENKNLHKLFFDEIVWTKNEEKERKNGLYLKTMELKKPQEKALHLFQYWPIMNLFNRLGLAEKIASDNADVYASAGLGGIIVMENDDVAFLKAGRLMERIWLKVEKMGLSFHLITGVLFLRQRINAGETSDLSKKHISLIKDAYEDIVKVFNVSEEKIVGLFFRIGKADAPTSFSSKKEPIIEFF